MKRIQKLLAGAGLALVMNLVGVLGFNAVASASCIQYDANGTSTTSTPAFNAFCNVPDGVGNEADFVRVRPSTGDDTSPANNDAYVDTLNAACNDGDAFDVRTYIHNGASPDYNGNGSGSAVAHNVQLAMTAPLGSTNSSFTFGSTVSASNAATVHDTGTLKCNNGKEVKLSLVPNTVHIYSKPYGGWKSLGDQAVNGTTKVGSPTLGSGDQWACWDYRVVVVYEVKVTVIPPKPVVNAACTLFTIDALSGRTVKVTDFDTSVQNATFKSALIDWGDHTDSGTLKDAGDIVGIEHTYAKDGKYKIAATVTFTSNVDGSTITSTPDKSACYGTATFKPQQPPIVTPPPTTPPTPPTPPTTLVNTGAGSVAGIFAIAAAAGTLGYRFFLGRRLNREA